MREPHHRPVAGAAAEADLPADERTLRDYPMTRLGVLALSVWLVAVIVIGFLAMSNARMALLAMTAMICTAIFGYGIAALLTPLDQTEASRFPRIVAAIGGVVSGFTLGKAGAIAEFLKSTLPAQPSDFVDTMFLLVGPLSTFLTGLIAGFVVRTAQVSLEENRRRLARQRETTRPEDRPPLPR